jgi:hypothetical protein
LAISKKKSTFVRLKYEVEGMRFRYIFLNVLLLASSVVMAQKVTLGACVTKDGGNYQGEMQSGKPHGKGVTKWKNGNVFEGNYEKGKRQGYGVYTFFDGEKYEGE